MATMQKLASQSASTGSSYSLCRAVTIEVAPAAEPEQFPAGLRVLVVDDDVTCLKILEHMLRKCRYHVTTCSQAMTALSLLRERKGGFDVIISDVHMPDIDGFKLLELVGLEMDLPVIMMSADGRTSAVMRGIKHGACDYLIKPIRIEELKNVWQHVVRKKWNGNRDLENSGSFEDSDRQIRVADESEYTSSVNEATDGSWKIQKKKRDSKDEEDDGELDNEDPSASKKPRVVWSVELHQQFVNAVNQLGIDKAVPKRILELMNVPGLTRENVASHLQKFRLYLKRISGVTQHQSALPSLFCDQVEANTKVGSLGRLDFQSLAASGQIPPQTLAALHAEFLGHPSGNIVLPAVDQPVILQASTQGSKFPPSEKDVAFGQPLFKCQSGIQQQFPPPGITAQDMSSGFSSWPSHKLAGSCDNENNNLLMQMLQHQQQHEHHQESFHPLVIDSHNAINVQPSCLVVPSQSPRSVNGGTNLAPPMNQKPVLTTSNGNSKNIDLLNTYYPTSMPPTIFSSSVCTRNSAGWRPQNSSVKVGLINRMPNPCIQGSDLNSGTSINQVRVRNLGFVGKGTSLPSRFAVDDLESPTNEHADKVKQEINLDFLDGSKVGNTMLQSFPSNDFMGVLSYDSQAGCFLKS